MKSANTPNDGATPPDAAPRILSVPIGLTATGTRVETDSTGAIDVLADRYWGAQTQRSGGCTITTAAVRHSNCEFRRGDEAEPRVRSG